MNKQKLEEEYPFPSDILRAYDDYDKTVEKEDNLYEFYRNKMTYHNEDKNNYTDISVKILRNLRTLSDDAYKPSQKAEYCIYLYHWLYYRKKESGIGDLLLSTIFSEFDEKKLYENKNMCPYNIYSKISAESDEIIKLDIFYNNIEAIRDILIDVDKSNDCRFKIFIHSCVNIYKKMKKKYCKTDSDRNSTNKEICDIVNNFSLVYNSFILDKPQEIKINLPSLTNTDSEGHPITTHIDGCSSNGNKEEAHAVNNDQSDSSILHTVPKILGTMAGISSFMAISYKFTPFRKFLQLRRGAASLSNSLNEKESINLINNESDPWNGSSNNTKYNIGYGSV
ncbi:PIR protein [Plasmodium vivax]|uniref:VIR protein n=1 Tax=Plasmodium vivax TaxID=5855 RepID=A0A565A626_PLAVI|nr:PIR protein [Plasmodium vivax]